VQNVVTYDVIVKVDNTELKLKPGMTANVSIVIDDKKGILRVPNAALRVKILDKSSAAPAPKGPGVWVLENKKPKRVPLSIGNSDNRFTEDVSGKILQGAPVNVEVQSNDQKNAATQTPRPGPRF
jgi:HlyD family secretion protein